MLNKKVLEICLFPYDLTASKQKLQCRPRQNIIRGILKSFDIKGVNFLPIPNPETVVIYIEPQNISVDIIHELVQSWANTYDCNRIMTGCEFEKFLETEKKAASDVPAADAACVAAG